MSDISEVFNVLEAAIYDVLAAESGITDVIEADNIVRGTAQMYTGHPVLTYTLVTGNEANQTPVERLNLLYEFVAIVTSSPAEAATVAGVVHEALNRVELTVAGWKNILSRVEDIIAYTEFRIQPAYETYQAGRYIRFILTKSGG